jgi:hypothetical protein
VPAKQPGCGWLQRWAGTAGPQSLQPEHTEFAFQANSKPRVQHLNFNLHAGVSVPGGLPAARERLLRHRARLPLALERLSVLDDGRICYRMKDGDQARLMTPTQFLARLAVLVPAPSLDSSDALRFARLSRLAWAILYQRVFDIDPLECSSCGGRMRFVEVTQPALARTFRGYERAAFQQPRRLDAGPGARLPEEIDPAIAFQDGCRIVASSSIGITPRCRLCTVCSATISTSSVPAIVRRGHVRSTSLPACALWAKKCRSWPRTRRRPFAASPSASAATGAPDDSRATCLRISTAPGSATERPVLGTGASRITG